MRLWSVAIQNQKPHCQMVLNGPKQTHFTILVSSQWNERKMLCRSFKTRQVVSGARSDGQTKIDRQCLIEIIISPWKEVCICFAFVITITNVFPTSINLNSSWWQLTQFNSTECEPYTDELLPRTRPNVNFQFLSKVFNLSCVRFIEINTVTSKKL